MSKLKIDIYSHNFMVSGLSDKAKADLFDYCKGCAQYDLVPIGGGRMQRVMVRVFAATTADRSEFRFHINQYAEVRAHLTARGYEDESIAVQLHQPPVGAVVDFRMFDSQIARDYQIPIVEFLSSPEKTKCVTLQTGKGKDQPLDAAIKIPGGWSTMGEMKVGTKVTAWDGSATEVTGVFPQGSKDVYRITFADGRTTEAGAEHLWKVYYINTTVAKRWKIVNTLEMLRLISMPNPRVYVPLIESEDCPDVPLLIKPYTLGVILGDGNMTGTNVNVSKGDEEIFKLLEAELPIGIKLVKRDYITSCFVGDGRVGGNEIINSLRTYGLMGCKSDKKFIPTDYLKGSRAQRLAILQGMLDTDGTVQRSGSVSFSSTSNELALGVQYLVRSLGGIAALRPRQTYFTYKDELKPGKICYEVDIRHKTPSELFRLTRKQSRTNDGNQYSASLKLRVSSVEFSGVKETQCISIAHTDKLYVTDDFIVTHNTFCALSAVAKMGERAFLVIKGMFVEKWISDVKEAYGLDYGSKSEDLMVIRGSAALKCAMILAQTGQLKSKFIICTNKTFYNYLEAYELYKEEIVSLDYPIMPIDFFKAFGIGVRVIDEVHMDFHLNFRIDLYTNVRTSISLSATMESDDSFINKQYSVAFPHHTRFQGAVYDKYISVKALYYQTEKPRDIRWKARGRTSYSHITYEEWVMRNKTIMASYLRMIEYIVKTAFVSKRTPGQSMLIFAATKELCTIIAKHLKPLLPDLLVNRYIGEDKYEDFLKADIAVSTIKSAGTAVDKPGLRIVLMTDALGTRQGNSQALGRLRVMKDSPEITPEFLYLVNMDVPKHLEYHYRKVENFADKVLSHKTYTLPFKL